MFKNKEKFKLMCERDCPIKGLGCEAGAMEDCDLAFYIKTKSEEMAKIIKEILIGKDHFSYEENWYLELKREAIKAGLTEKEFLDVEDKAINLFLLEKNRLLSGRKEEK